MSNTQQKQLLAALVGYHTISIFVKMITVKQMPGETYRKNHFTQQKRWEGLFNNF